MAESHLINRTDEKVQRFIEREEIYDQLYKLSIVQHHRLLQEKQSEKQELIKLWSAPQQPFRVKRPRIEFRQKDLIEIARRNMKLVPVRLDVEYEGQKLRDTFTWNLYDDLISPEGFAKIICEDTNMHSSCVPVITKQIKDQIEDYFQHAPETLENLESWTKGIEEGDQVDKDLPELRTIIKLDITIDNQSVIDQFEWDIACRRNSPEKFAEIMVKELGLLPEFRTAIAHSIREQIYNLAKSLLIINHNFYSGQVRDEQLATMFLPQIQSGMLRRGIKETGEFGPIVQKTSQADIEKLEKDLDRELRRKRRQTQRSRRVASIPERENTKTHRTSLPNTIKFIPVPKPDPDAFKAEIVEVDPEELLDWECSHCKMPGIETSAVRNGPFGPKTLCNDCGLFFKQNGTLPILT